ncbi:S-adenosyl-L-methionine-dependent methyltransferase [Penicillium chermesinum]|nr:S-adenosyl-L-methionine-dependent methyltransferase [Penicillium chermesinum]
MDRLRGSPATILQAMDEFSAQTDFLINISWDKGGKVADLIKQDKPAVLVELGGYVGYSAILFGDAARQAGTEGVKLWSIEYDPLIASIAMNLIDLAGLSDIVKVVVGSATDTIRRLKVNGDLQKIDFWFLDHDEDLYVQEFKLCEELDFFPAGALVVADNVVRPGAPQYREYVRQHSGVESWGVPGLIIPGDFADELEVTRIR